MSNVKARDGKVVIQGNDDVTIAQFTAATVTLVAPSTAAASTTAPTTASQDILNLAVKNIVTILQANKLAL